MRVNPLHDSTCWKRVGMYRTGQCTDGPHPCVFLGECDQHYCEKTGDWDYPQLIRPSTRKLATGKHFKRTANEQAQIDRMAGL
jgi:hypothetical protein